MNRPARSVNYTLRLTPAERALLDRTAEVRGEHPSEILRRGMEREFERELGEEFTDDRSRE